MTRPPARHHVGGAWPPKARSTQCACVASRESAVPRVEAAFVDGACGSGAGRRRAPGAAPGAGGFRTAAVAAGRRAAAAGA
eukprot:scaffold71390_cov61-Phaeocystis_antarctica.AAC.3